ncbi:uncharacterized protein [Palaemon carinicauda]|uniref:uncharacterized protein n=1 Tax=Palaemon carinicauda TaxID=392227 RepID=UPI0035B63386
MKIVSPLLRVFPSQERKDNLRRIIEEFLLHPTPRVSLWMSLLGHLASLTLLVPNGRRCMRDLQFQLRQHWDWQGNTKQIQWTARSQEDLLWWSQEIHLNAGLSLKVLEPTLVLHTDASDIGWGTSLEQESIARFWTPSQNSRSINWRELKAIREAVLHFTPLCTSEVVAVYADNSTTISYLKKEGGTKSQPLNLLAQEILQWAEDHNVILRPQFIPGKKNVIADALSRGDQVIGSEWTLCQEVVDRLVHLWPSNIDLFATALNFRIPAYFSPQTDPQSAGVDAML